MEQWFSFTILYWRLRSSFRLVLVLCFIIIIIISTIKPNKPLTSPYQHIQPIVSQYRKVPNFIMGQRKRAKGNNEPTFKAFRYWIEHEQR